MPNLISQCLTCNKTFSYWSSHSKGLFCSKTCDIKYKEIKKKQCVICGKDYVPDKGNKDKWNKSKYCSLNCLNESKFKGSFKRCSNYRCYNLVWITPKRITKRGKNFCSSECWGKYMVNRIMGNKNYIRGRSAEYECIHILENKGYHCVRSGASLGVADIIAINSNEIRVIQSKLSKNEKYTFPKIDRIKFESLVVPNNVIKELWVKVVRKGWKIYEIKEDKVLLKGGVDILDKQEIC